MLDEWGVGEVEEGVRKKGGGGGRGGRSRGQLWREAWKAFESNLRGSREGEIKMRCLIGGLIRFRVCFGCLGVGWR